MKKIICLFLTFIILLTLCTPTFAASAVTIASYTEHYEKINRFLSIGESIDVTGGYVTFLLSDRKQGKKNLTNDMLKSVPDTSTIGYKRAEYELYNLTLSVNFMVLDNTKSASRFKDLNKNSWAYTHINNGVKAVSIWGRKGFDRVVRWYGKRAVILGHTLKTQA